MSACQLRTRLIAAATLAFLSLAVLSSNEARSSSVTGPKLAQVTCDDAVASIKRPRGLGYVNRLARFPAGSAVQQIGPTEIADFPYFAKVALIVAAGGGPFTIEIARTWHGRAGMAWDSGGVADPAFARGVRVWPCRHGDDNGNWFAYPGGFYVQGPTCLPLLITIARKRYRARVPLGRACR